jgi:hypothetical protein
MALRREKCDECVQRPEDVQQNVTRGLAFLEPHGSECPLIVHLVGLRLVKRAGSSAGKHAGEELVRRLLTHLGNDHERRIIGRPETIASDKHAFGFVSLTHPELVSPNDFDRPVVWQQLTGNPVSVLKV